MSVTIKEAKEIGIVPVEENFYPKEYYFLSMPQEDREVFAGIIKQRQPKTYFEFGTGRGTSIDTVRAFVPDCDIWSMDIVDPKKARTLNVGLGPIDNKANYIICNSHGWVIPELFYHRFDIVLVDGGHDMPCVAADTARAIQMVKVGGTIIWHDLVRDAADYQPLPYLEKCFPYEVTWVKDTTVGFWVKER